MYGEGCLHPGVPVVRGGTEATSGCVHHVDEDRSNNMRENLWPMHIACHSALPHEHDAHGDVCITSSTFVIGHTHSDETREKMRKPKSEKQRANMQRAQAERFGGFTRNMLVRFADEIGYPPSTGIGVQPATRPKDRERFRALLVAWCEERGITCTI